MYPFSRSLYHQIMTSLTALIPPQTIVHTPESANAMDDLWQSCQQVADAGDPDDRDKLLHEFHELGQRLINWFSGSLLLQDKLILLRSDIEITEDPDERNLNLLLMKHVVELAILGSLVRQR